jgi:hypothetical protein
LFDAVGGYHYRELKIIPSFSNRIVLIFMLKVKHVKTLLTSYHKIVVRKIALKICGLEDYSFIGDTRDSKKHVGELRLEIIKAPRFRVNCG